MGPIKPPSTLSLTSTPDLQAFERAAQDSPQVHLSRDGSQWKLLGSGMTPSQRAVSWVVPEGGDTQSAFIDALGQSFSSGIQSAIVRELGLGPAPGKPLAASTVKEAIAMGHTGSAAMLGVDFMTQQSVSARAGAAAFVQVCAALQLDAATVAAPLRQDIDRQMQERFTTASAQGQSPVTLETARQWLHEILRNAMAKGC